MFTDDCKVWKRRPAVQKTWAQLKTDFSVAHAELRESQHTNRTGGYANNVEDIQQETATAIANLANATLADRDTMTAMQATITTLTAQLAGVNTQLVDSINASATLKAQVATLTANSYGGGGGGNSGGVNGGGGQHRNFNTAFKFDPLLLDPWS